MTADELVRRVQRLVDQRNEWHYSDKQILDLIEEQRTRVFGNGRYCGPDQYDALVILVAYHLLTEDTAIDRLRSMV